MTTTPYIYAIFHGEVDESGRAYPSDMGGDLSIHEAADEAEARAHVLATAGDYDPGTALEVVEVGSWGDCWAKTYSPVAEAEDEFDGIPSEYLYIQRPGQHPGGSAYWLTPSIPTFGVVATPPETET